MLPVDIIFTPLLAKPAWHAPLDQLMLQKADLDMSCCCCERPRCISCSFNAKKMSIQTQNYINDVRGQRRPFGSQTKN
jgi:hypothetical protein